MTKTRVDDSMLEMIKPKIEEIEKKFSSEEKLTQEDINTLLLKSQFNHINHLDDKLNEVTADVATLKGDFKDLEYKLTSNFKDLENKFGNLENKFGNLENKVDNKISALEVTIEKAMNRNLKQTFYVMGFFLVVIKGFDVLENFIK